MTTVFVQAFGGKSHSWLTPRISRSKPSAKRISVADGSSETMRMTDATLTQFRRRLFVEEILAANLVEGGQTRGPARNDLFGSRTGVQLLNGIGISGEQEKFLGIELLGVELLQNCGNFQTRAHGPCRESIRDADRHASATLAAIGTADGNEGLRHKMDAGKMALVQRDGYIVAAEPGCPKLFERRLRASAHGDTGVLQDFNPRVEDGTLRSTKIRRRRDPLDSRAIKEIVAMPVLHGDDVEVGADVVFGIEELGELANREPVSHGQRKIADETCFVGIKHRAFDDLSAQRIRTVQNKEGDVAFGGFFHAVSHRRRVGVEADAGVLNVEDERVDAFEHLLRRAERLAIEAMDGETGGGILGRRDLFIVAAGEAVFGAEESEALTSGGT